MAKRAIAVGALPGPAPEPEPALVPMEQAITYPIAPSGSVTVGSMWVNGVEFRPVVTTTGNIAFGPVQDTGDMLLSGVGRLDE